MGRIHKTATVMLWMIVLVVLCSLHTKSMKRSGPKYHKPLVTQIATIKVTMKLFSVTKETE